MGAENKLHFAPPNKFGGGTCRNQTGYIEPQINTDRHRFFPAPAAQRKITKLFIQNAGSPSANREKPFLKKGLFPEPFSQKLLTLLGERFSYRV